MTNATNHAYAAGVIDSDGYIGVHRRQVGSWQANYQPRVQVKQVTPEATDLLYELYGGHIYRQDPSTTNGRPLWSWTVHSAAVRRVLVPLLPYLRIKRAQAENALALCDVNAQLGTRRFPVPVVVRGEEMVTAAEAAEATGLTYESVCQAVRKGSVPSLRDGRRILIPKSFLETWRTRGSSPTRDPAISARLHEHFLRAKELNRVGV